MAAGEPRVFGEVVDTSGTPVENAVASLFDHSTGATATARTDAAGRYDFPTSRGRLGLFRLRLECAGHGTRVTDELHTSLQPRRDVLAAELVIRGRVVDTAGRAVAPCRVVAVRLPFQRSEEWDDVLALTRQVVPPALRTDASADVTDGSGTFCLRRLAAGKFALLVDAPGRQPVYFNGGGRSYDRYRGVDAQPEAEAVEQLISLPAGGHVFVDVVERDGGLPVRNARVVTYLDVARGEFQFANTRTVESVPGRFEVPVGLDVRGNLGFLDCLVDAPGHAPRRLGVGGQANGHVFVVALGRPATVRGCVRDAEGRPVVAAVVLVECEIDGALLGSAHTGEDGHYEIRGIDAPSAHVLRCLRPALDRVLAAVALQLRDGEERVIDIGGAAATQLSGTVRVRGQPQPDALVIADAIGADTSLRCTTRDDGGFAFAGLPPGRYELIALPGGHRNLRGERILDVGAAGQRCDFDFGLTIAGRVELVGNDRRELPDAMVVAKHLGAAGTSARVDVGEGGRFELLVTEPGAYGVEVDGGDALVTLAAREVDLRTAVSVQDIVLQVARDAHEGRIELHCVDAASGQPVSGSIGMQHANTRGGALVENGLYVDEAAGLGRHRFEVTTEQHRPAVVEVEITSFQLRVERRVELHPATAVEVSEVAPAGNAHRSGIKAGDHLRRYGGVEVRSVAELKAAIATSRGPVTVVVARDGVEWSLTVEAGPLGISATNVR